MRTFHCEHCRNSLFFENTQCNHCGRTLGLLPDFLRLSALEPDSHGHWRPLLPAAKGRLYRKCANYSRHHVCNWMVPAQDPEQYCVACRLNRVIPNLSRQGYADRWFRLERSKRRLLYSLLKLGLPLSSPRGDRRVDLCFSFLSAQDAADQQPVLTGHANGHITINIDEADPAQRERLRLDMQEKYRTLLGHFRHEIGHYYWDLLIRDQEPLAEFRHLFGDERRDYAAALDQYYAKGAPHDWQQYFITRYASAHPWEDWAETWAHYLHIVDTLETAAHFGLKMERTLATGEIHRAGPDFDPYTLDRFQPIIDHWIPFTYALNSLNRSMGLQDLYPFVIPDKAIAKLDFVHRIVRGQHASLSDEDSIELPGLPSKGGGQVIGRLRNWLRALRA